jgi:lysophospholipase L1-like esterase
VSLVVAGVAGEGLFRLAARFAPALQHLNPPVLVEDAVTEHALLPGITTRLVSAEGEFDNVVVINALGFHDVPRRPEKAQDACRIVVVGDSLVEGLHVPETHTLTQVAERRLRAAGHVPVEVWNAGISGTSPALQYLLVRERVVQLRPDLVVLGVFMNDVSEDQAFRSLIAFDADGRPQRLLATTSHTAFVPQGVKRFLQRHSRLAVALANVARHRGAAVRRIFSEGPIEFREGEVPGDIFAALREPTTPALDAAWATTTALIGHIAALATDHGGAFALMIVPVGPQVDAREWAQGRAVWRLRGNPSSRPQRILDEWGRSRGVAVLDLTPALRGADDFPLYFPFDGHLTAGGHRVAGEALATFLASRLDNVCGRSR